MGWIERRLKYLLVAPALLVVTALAAFPLLQSLIGSLFVWRLNRAPGPTKFIGLAHYERALTDPLFWNSAMVTGLFTLSSVILTTAISLAFAMALSVPGRSTRAMRVLLILPFAMSPALIGMSFRYMFNADFGVVPALLGALYAPLGQIDWLADPMAALVVVILCDAWGWFPFMTMMIMGGLRTVPRDAQEAARVDGATPWQVFRDVTLPCLRPVLLVAMVLKTIFCLKMFDQVFLLTNGGPYHATQTMSHYIYTQSMRFYDLGYGSALSWLLVLPMAVLVYFYTRQILLQSSARQRDAR